MEFKAEVDLASASRSLTAEARPTWYLKGQLASPYGIYLGRTTPTAPALGCDRLRLSPRSLWALTIFRLVQRKAWHSRFSLC